MVDSVWFMVDFFVDFWWIFSILGEFFWFMEDFWWIFFIYGRFFFIYGRFFIYFWLIKGNVNKIMSHIAISELKLVDDMSVAQIEIDNRNERNLRYGKLGTKCEENYI